MTAGLGLLRMPPQVFWNMTVPELTAALGGLEGLGAPAPAPARGELDALMQRFPDQPAAPRPVRGPLR